MLRSIVFILFVFSRCISPHVLLAQNDENGALSDTTTANGYFEQAEKFFNEAKYDSSIIYFEKAGLIYEKEQSWSKYVQCLNKIGDDYRLKGQYDRAMNYLNKALVIGSDKLSEKHFAIAQNYNATGNVYYVKGDNDQALQFYQKALTIRLEVLGERHTDVATSYNNIGNIYDEKSDYDKALQLHQKCLSILLDIQGEKHSLVARSYNNIGNIYAKKSDYDKALQFHQKALSIRLEVLGEKHPDVADSYNSIGTDYYYKDDYDKTLLFQQKALSIKLEVFGEMHPNVARSYNNIGVLYYTKGDYDKGLEYYQKALSIRIAALGADHPDVAGSYHNIGVIYFAKCDYDKGLEYSWKALSIKVAVLGEKHPFIAASYTNIGNAYNNKGDYEKALQFYQKSLSIYLDVFDEKHPSVAMIFQNIADIYFHKVDYSKALEYFQKALSINLKAIGERHSDVAFNYINIGCTLYEQGNYDKALQFHKKALSIRSEIYSDKHPLTANAYQEIGKVFYKQNKIIRALEYYQKSIISLFQEFNETSIYANPSLTNISSETTLLTSLELKAEALDKLYTLKSRNIRNLILANSTYELASDLLHKIRTNYQSDVSRLQLGEQAYKIYHKAISTALRLYEITHKYEYKEKAFAFSEKSKASVLLQALSESHAKHFAGIPADLLEKERDIKINLAFYEKNLFEEQGKGKEAVTSKITLCQDKLFTLKRGYDTLTYRFETDYPEYYNLKYKTSTITPKEIQTKLLKKNDALVEYFTGDSVIFIFTLTPQSFDITTVRKETIFDEQVKSMQEGLTKRNYTLYSENAYLLYQTLIEPIKTTVAGKNLIIIPDGVLGYIPFETLLTQKADISRKDYRQLAYLIKDNQIRYDYSSTLLYENMNKGKRNDENRYIGFAPVTFK